MIGSDIGIDLGTASILVYIKGKGVVLKEPSVVAFDRDTNKIKAIGEEARLMLGRTPGNIVAVRPLRQGVISDYTVTEKMIKYFIQKALGKKSFRKPRISVCVPSGVTEVEKKAVEDATYQAGAREVEIIEEPMIIHKMGTAHERKAIVQELIETVGLKPDHIRRYPHEFSGGQRQRIGIARTLALRPEFIVCDEPISALDVSIQAQVINLLEKLQRERGFSYLFIAHDLEMVYHISHKIGVMYLGNMVELGSSDDVYKKPLHPYTRALISAAPIADPHLAKEKNRIILEGEVPSPLNPPAGCPFAGRCRYASESCRQKKPENYEYDNRKVACNLYSPENLAKYKAVGKTPEQILAE